MAKSNLESMTAGEIYQQIYSWYKDSGLSQLRSLGEDWDPEYLQRSEDLINKLPQPEKAEPADWYFVFQMISSDLLEWADQESDTTGISMGEYARYALQDKEDEIGFDELFDFLRESKLFKEFSRVF